MTSVRALVFVLIPILIQCSECARILALFPTPSISHQVVFRPLTQELARRGHQVTVVTTDPAFPPGQAPENLTEINLHDFSYKLWKELFVKKTQFGQKGNLAIDMIRILQTLIEVSEVQMRSVAIQDLVKDKSKKFDLLLIEACARPFLVFSHLYKAPAIYVSSFGPAFGLDFFGTATHHLLYPIPIQQRTYNMTSWEKIKELYLRYQVDTWYSSMKETEHDYLKNIFGADVPSINELQNNVHMIFLNNHPLWDNNRPVPPSVVYIGGIHMKPEKELPKDLKWYLDSSERGVIYMSFGTNADPALLPPERVHVLARALAALPHRVLWKWNTDDVPSTAANIRFSKWFPQSDLLRHPNVKLFITQGGLQSTDEAIAAGVPMIGIPMLGDQWYNCEHYERLGIGIKLDVETVTEEQLTSAIHKILNNDRYKEAVVRLRTVTSDQPERALARAAWWTEHVVRHSGALHLRTSQHNLTLAQYLELDLILIALAVLCLCITLIGFLIYVLSKYALVLIRYNSVPSVKTDISLK